MEAQCKCDALRMSYNQLKHTLDQLQAEGIAMPDPQEHLDAVGTEDVIQGYLDRIAELEMENRSLKDLKEISEEFMSRASVGPSASRASMQLPRTSFGTIPELEEVDQDLVDEQMVAAEEEAYRFTQFNILIFEAWDTDWSSNDWARSCRRWRGAWR